MHSQKDMGRRGRDSRPRSDRIRGFQWVLAGSVGNTKHECLTHTVYRRQAKIGRYALDTRWPLVAQTYEYSVIHRYLFVSSFYPIDMVSYGDLSHSCHGDVSLARSARRNPGYIASKRSCLAQNRAIRQFRGYRSSWSEHGKICWMVLHAKAAAAQLDIYAESLSGCFVCFIAHTERGIYYASDCSANRGAL